MHKIYSKRNQLIVRKYDIDVLIILMAIPRCEVTFVSVCVYTFNIYSVDIITVPAFHRVLYHSYVRVRTYRGVCVQLRCTITLSMDCCGHDEHTYIYTLYKLIMFPRLFREREGYILKSGNSNSRRVNLDLLQCILYFCTVVSLRHNCTTYDISYI